MEFQKFQNEMIEFEASESDFADSQQQIRLPRSRDDSDVSTDDEGWLPDSFVDWNSQPEYNTSQSAKGTFKNLFSFGEKLE